MPLNFRLMAHPLNWIIVVLVVMIWGMGIAAIFPNLPNPVEKSQ